MNMTNKEVVMDRFLVCYIKEGKEQKEVIEIPKNRNVSSTRAFNEFFRKMRKRGYDKKTVKVKSIHAL